MSLNFRDEDGTERVFDVDATFTLAEVQRGLCKSFEQRFPFMKATLRVRGKLFDDFVAKPFLEAEEGDVITVSFMRTDDPFFYDVADRVPNNAACVGPGMLVFDKRNSCQGNRDPFDERKSDHSED